MTFGAGAAVRCAIFVAAVLLASGLSGADARQANGIPKSAPAFTKFVARFVEQALPGAKVTIVGRLQLDVEPPGGQRHTTDLHNVYSVCNRNPETCDAEVTTFVADMVYVYKTKDAAPSRATLRFVVRPSAYVAALRVNPKRNRPIAMPFAGDYWVILVDDRPTTIAMLDENDLAGLNLSIKDAKTLAFVNTLDALGRSLHKELSTGCRGILNGDSYTASTVVFIDEWLAAAQRCHGDMYVAIPASDVVLYTVGTADMKSFVDYANQIVAKAEKPFSSAVFRLTDKGWVPAALPK